MPIYRQLLERTLGARDVSSTYLALDTKGGVILYVSPVSTANQVVSGGIGWYPTKELSRTA
jgi:hypothetical protein